MPYPYRSSGSLRNSPREPSLLSSLLSWLFDDKSEPTKKEDIIKPNGTINKKPKVFLSYNHEDIFVMRAVKSYLEEQQIEVTVDINDIKAGQEIMKFIEKSLKENDFVLSIISKNSLLSGWVNKELSATYLFEKLGKSKWIPARIDNACFDSDFFFASVSKLDNNLSMIQENIKKGFTLGQNPNAFFEEYNRIQDLKNNLSNTISKLKEVSVIDISGERFDLGMNKIAKQIKNT